jgi:hypothetical protein
MITTIFIIGAVLYLVLQLRPKPQPPTIIYVQPEVETESSGGIGAIIPPLLIGIIIWLLSRFPS